MGSRGRTGAQSASPYAAGGSGWQHEPWWSRIVLPTTPFARLSLLHATSAMGDTLVSFALAKTLFFVSPDDARSKVLLYLLLTLAPFAIVSPFVGPLIDRFHAQRRWVVFAVTAVRAVVCLLLARDYDTLLLFPEAFTMLVLSKGYAVARSSLVPSVVSRPGELVRANSKLALVAALAGLVVAIPGGVASLVGPWLVLLLAMLVFGVAAFFATQLIVPDTLPVGARDEVTPAGTGMPRTSRERAENPITRLRLAVLSMAVERGLIGFVTFLVAFTFKREGVATWWLGVVAAGAAIGLVLGSGIAPLMRRHLDELTMLLLALGAEAVLCALAVLSPGLAVSALIALITAVGASVARLAFDALVQREGRADQHGASFARFETRFQLAWVLGATIPVASSISRGVGFALLAAIAAAAVVVQAGGERSLERIDTTLEAGRTAWHRPVRPTETDWESPDSSDWDL